MQPRGKKQRSKNVIEELSLTSSEMSTATKGRTRTGPRTISSRASSMNSDAVDGRSTALGATPPPPSPHLKSTGFYPVYMSPSARYDIVDHMSSHYRRIGSAKATVDTSPPKSYLMSRRSPSPGGSTRSTSRASSATRRSIDRRGDGEDVLRSSAIVRTSSRINYYLEALRREQQRLLTQVGSQEKAYYRQRQRPSSSDHQLHNRSRLRPDLLDRHADRFTPSDKPFVPRLLRTPATSRLPEYRWYNPPKMKKSQSQKSQFEDDRSSVTATSSKMAVGASEKKRNGKIVSRQVSTDVEEDENDKEEEEEEEDRQSCRSYVINGKPPQSDLQPASTTSSERRSSRLSREDVKKAEEEDESKYVEFVVDVTNDILARGIYTNKVVKRVFRNHLDKRKGDLNMAKMEKALEKLQEDLGIPDTDDGDGASFGYGHRGEVVPTKNNASSDRFEPSLVNGNHNKGSRKGSIDYNRNRNETLNGLNRHSRPTHSDSSESISGDEVSIHSGHPTSKGDDDHRENEDSHYSDDSETGRRLEDLLIRDDDDNDFFEDGDGR